LGLAQLEMLDEFLQRKRAIAARYRQGFAGSAVTVAPAVSADAWSVSSNWLNGIAIDGSRAGIDRHRVFEHLRGRGIDSRPIWTPLHLQAPYLSAPRLGGQVAETIFAQGLCLPSSVGLTAAAQDRVIAAVHDSLTSGGR
jgi:dTDP-4-amino-4,6-dideoxygalactose transaminase